MARLSSGVRVFLLAHEPVLGPAAATAPHRPEDVVLVRGHDVAVAVAVGERLKAPQAAVQGRTLAYG